MTNFIHLHNHTQYSLLDGACKIHETVKRVRELGYSHYAITDHGNMHGAIEFYTECKEHGIIPIIGCEFYIAPESRHLKEKTTKPASYHLVLLAKDYQGYQNLMKLSSIAFTEGFYYKPRIDKAILKEYSAGLIGMSACLKGELAQAILNNDDTLLKQSVTEFCDILGKENFYLELHNHGIPEEDKVRLALHKFALKNNFNLVGTNDTHYLNHGDHVAHDALLCIQTGRRVTDTDRMKYSTHELYLKSQSDMVEMFGQYKGAVENTLRIAEQCNLEIPFGSLLPKFDVPEGRTPYNHLGHLVMAGSDKRFGGMSDDVKARLKYELGVIKKTGFAEYFLIVQDFVNYAKSQNIPVGPARGSVGGSLVAYCLGITDINPMDYGLMFERFLNPDRISLPDIDIDFSDKERQRVVDYVTSKYGAKNVSQIVTFGAMNARAVVRDVGRTLEIPVYACDQIAKTINIHRGKSESLEEQKGLESKMNSLHPDFYDIATTLEGLKRHASVHAAGVLISPIPIQDVCPVMLSKDGVVCSQYDMTAVEKLGLVKMDFLGLRTLSVIKDTLELAKLPYNFLESIPLNDPKAMDIFREGKTIGIFQFESGGMRHYLRALAPENIEDLSAMNALYRPGPLDNKMIDSYIKRKHGKESISYIHESMKGPLESTYGVMVYQEQIIKLSQVMAGFTAAEGDILRKAIGKKKMDLMKEQRDKFIQGCVKNQINTKTAEDVFNAIEKFGDYCFNKSHSTGYALLAYQTAYLKAHYPKEFMSALLNSEIGDTNRLRVILSECRNLNIDILSPSVNYSEDICAPEGDKIRIGLSVVRNIGSDLAEAIHKHRPYKSIYDFCIRLDQKLYNIRKLESLIKAGGFDEFGTRNAHLLEAPKANEVGRLDSKFNYLVGIPTLQVGPTLEFAPEILASGEKETLGIYLTANPLYKHLFQFNTLGCTHFNDMEESPISFYKNIFVVNGVKYKNDRNGNRMAFVMVEDEFNEVEMLIFAKKLPAVKLGVGDIWFAEVKKSGDKVLLQGEPLILEFAEEG